MTGLEGIAELGKVVAFYTAIGLSAGTGAVLGVLVNSKEKGRTTRKNILDNLPWSLGATLLMGTAGTLLTGAQIDGVFLIAFLAFCLLALTCSQLAQYIGLRLSEDHILMVLLSGLFFLVMFFSFSPRNRTFRNANPLWRLPSFICFYFKGRK